MSRGNLATFDFGWLLIIRKLYLFLASETALCPVSHCTFVTIFLYKYPNSQSQVFNERKEAMAVTRKTVCVRVYLCAHDVDRHLLTPNQLSKLFLSTSKVRRSVGLERLLFLKKVNKLMDRYSLKNRTLMVGYYSYTSPAVLLVLHILPLPKQRKNCRASSASAQWICSPSLSHRCYLLLNQLSALQRTAPTMGSSSSSNSGFLVGSTSPSTVMLLYSNNLNSLSLKIF